MSGGMVSASATQKRHAKSQSENFGMMAFDLDQPEDVVDDSSYGRTSKRRRLTYDCNALPSDGFVGDGKMLERGDHEAGPGTTENTRATHRSQSRHDYFNGIACHLHGCSRSHIPFYYGDGKTPVARQQTERVHYCHSTIEQHTLLSTPPGTTVQSNPNARNSIIHKQRPGKPENHFLFEEGFSSIPTPAQTDRSSVWEASHREGGHRDMGDACGMFSSTADNLRPRPCNQPSAESSISLPNEVASAKQNAVSRWVQQIPDVPAHMDKRIPGFYKPDALRDLFHRRVFKALPGRGECRALLGIYFRQFNQLIPLFHEASFMDMFDNAHSPTPHEGSGWWASINVALAIVSSASTDIGERQAHNPAWGYIKNALAVTNELTMYNADLLSVQALLGMALFFRGTHNPQPSFSLLSAAVRLSHAIKLHRNCCNSKLDEVEIEQRKRVFWLAYFLDKDTCLRSGRPSTQDDDDIDVDLPSETPTDNIGVVPLTKVDDAGRSSINVFRSMCTFAQIQSQIYKTLYSVSASKQSKQKLSTTTEELVSELEAWKESIPTEFRPGHEIDAACWPYRLHVVLLNFAYHYCVATICRLSVHRDRSQKTNGLEAWPPDPPVSASVSQCLHSSRASIRLIRCISRDDLDRVWVILYYPVSALVVLFANILREPRSAFARSDLALISSMVNFIARLECDDSSEVSYVRRMHSVCAGYERTARALLDRVEISTRG
jgi:hypothetical protein